MKLRQKVAQMLRSASDSLMSDVFRKSDVPRMPTDAMEESQMIDFRGDRFGATMNLTTGNSDPRDVAPEAAQKAVKIAVSPKSVVDELRRAPTNLSLSGLDAKIDILKKKRDLITQRYSAEHLDFMIAAMTARKKYDKKSKAAKCAYREFFSRYDTTDELKIKALLDKYALLMKSADLFVPEFPDEAITAMDICAKATKELTGKSPRFYVIATEKDFEKELARRDPILLVQSPFGMYYYILGAWDKEMIYLPEL